jgi:hypothetical protein
MRLRTILTVLVVAAGLVRADSLPAPGAAPAPSASASLRAQPPKLTTPTDIAQSLVTEGDALRAAGRLEDALARYRQALATLAHELQAAKPASGAVVNPYPGCASNRLASDLSAAAWHVLCTRG